jgi:signal transduction histidine kinase
MGVAARRRRQEAEIRVREAAATASAQLRQRLAEERLTIARELHDVLAHSISIIAVQSGAALDAIDTDTEAAREAMRSVRAVARQTLPDLRGALALLRGDEDRKIDLRSQPRLSELEDLVGSVRATGLAVTLAHRTGGEEFAPLTEVAAYRIVQEALTNVVRHAAATSATVTVRRDGTSLMIDVVDNGYGLDDRRPDGLGLIGMAERAALVGGTVTVSTPPSGTGTLVRATLPVDGAA